MAGLLRKSVVLGVISGLRAEDTAAVLPAAQIYITKIWLGPPKQNHCHKRYINLSSVICIVYHGLCICTRVDHGQYLHRAGPKAMGYRRCVEIYHRASKGYDECSVRSQTR